jgi:hypothetical protein
MGILEKFLPSEAVRRIFPGFIAFCVAGIGVALGAVASAASVPWLGILATAIVMLGVFGGFVFILYGWWRILRGDWRHPRD